MRLSFLLLLAVAGLACTDPSLQVQLDIPSPYREQVSSVSLAIIVPPLGTPFGCDEIAFSTIGDDVVEANTVEELPLRDTQAGSLKAIPREDYKLLYARGFDAQGEQIVAGCAEFGVIEGAETRVITAEAVTIAILPATGLGETATSTIVQIADYAGDPVGGVETRWTVTGPGAQPASDSAFSDQDGSLVISVEPPPLPGPATVDIHAKWARTEPPTIYGFREPAALLRRELSGPAESSGPVRDPEELYQVGRIGPNGELGIVGMGAVEAGQRQLSIAYFDLEQLEIREALTAPLPAAAASAFLITDAGRDRIYIFTPTELLSISPDGEVTSSPVVGVAGVVRKTFPLGDCSDPEATDSALLLYLGGETKAYGLDGFIDDSPFASASQTGEPLASGCISSGGSLHRAVVYEAGNNLVNVVVEMNDVVHTGTLGVIPAGISFSPQSTSEDALLLATTLGLEGTDLIGYTILPTGTNDIAFEPVTSDPTPTFARSTAAGDFDDDGHNDVAGVLTFGDTSNTTEYRLYITLGLPSARIAGVSRPAQGLRPRIWVRDFNRDGYDDIVVASANSFVIFSMAAP